MMRSPASPCLSCCRLFLLLALLLVLMPGQAMPTDIMDRLTHRDFATRSAAIESVVASAATGDETARELLQGLRENRVEGVRLNNALRRQVAEGSVLAEGTLAQVQSDERVIESYLGR